ncbi:MAG: tryptophan synthase subunit alpha [Deltaproteobacteria bacterium]
MRIQRKFEELKNIGKAALVTYITAGDPDIRLTPEIVLALERSGADIIELGIPFSDPIADGPVIQLASERSLKNGTTLADALDAVRAIREKSEIPIILFGYYNPFLAYGLSRFSLDAKEAGADGVLVVDLPPEEAGKLKSHTDAAGLDFIFLLAPTSTEDRIKLVAERASGFVYLVSVTGVTGARPDMNYSLEELVAGVRKIINLPVGVGFGVSSAEQAARISTFADAVIVGSALVRIIEENGSDSERLLGGLSELAGRLSGGCKKP